MDNYETLSVIGDGTFGTVYLCRKRNNVNTSSNRKSGDELFAVKKMKRRYYNWDDCLNLREVKALKNLNHRNIVLLKEVIRENNHLYLVFEHMEKNLYELIRAQLEPFDEQTVKHIILQIVRGLTYIHEHGFFHRDIKPENLLCRNGHATIKIADFGLTREIENRPPYTDYVSTRWYRAPELLLHSTDYNWTIDIWALGCIMCELYTLRPLFPGRSEIDQIYKICQVIGTPNVNDWAEGHRLASSIQFEFPNIVPLQLSDLLSNCSQDGIDLVKIMLQWIPKDRPTGSQIINHKYLKG